MTINKILKVEIMNIRKTASCDADALLALFDEARKTIAALGINQWQNGYPNREVVDEDISKCRSYIVEHDGMTAGSFALIEDGEPTYDKIYNGEWLTGDTDCYIAIHRVAVAVCMRGKGTAAEIIEYAKEFAREKGRKSVRIDTHEGNVVMRRMLEKNGFTYCGEIYLENGDPRVAYELII